MNLRRLCVLLCWMMESIDVNHISLIGGVKSCVLANFCPLALTIPDEEALHSPTTIVDAILSPCSSVIFALCVLTPSLGVYAH